MISNRKRNGHNNLSAENRPVWSFGGIMKKGIGEANGDSQCIFLRRTSFEQKKQTRRQLNRRGLFAVHGRDNSG